MILIGLKLTLWKSAVLIHRSGFHYGVKWSGLNTKKESKNGVLTLLCTPCSCIVGKPFVGLAVLVLRRTIWSNPTVLTDSTAEKPAPRIHRLSCDNCVRLRWWNILVCLQSIFFFFLLFRNILKPSPPLPSSKFVGKCKHNLSVWFNLTSKTSVEFIIHIRQWVGDGGYKYSQHRLTVGDFAPGSLPTSSRATNETTRGNDFRSACTNQHLRCLRLLFIILTAVCPTRYTSKVEVIAFWVYTYHTTWQPGVLFG